MQLAANDVVVDLTLVVNELIYFFDEYDRIFPPADRESMHPRVLSSWHPNNAASHYGWTEQDYERAHKVFPKVLEFARRLHEAGVKLAVGTDSMSGGSYLARELDLHVQAGIPVWDVLRLATSAGAANSGFHDTGSITVGKEADMVFLNSNPLEDISRVRDVKAVVTNGEHFTREELVAAALAVAERDQQD